MRLLKRLKVIVVIRGRTQGKFGMLLTSPLCLQAEVHISCRRSTRPGNLPRLPSPLCGLPRKANPVDVLRDPRAIRLVARGWRRGLHQHRSPSPLAGRILPWARPLPLIRPSLVRCNPAKYEAVMHREEWVRRAISTIDQIEKSALRQGISVSPIPCRGDKSLSLSHDAPPAPSGYRYITRPSQTASSLAATGKPQD